MLKRYLLFQLLFLLSLAAYSQSDYSLTEFNTIRLKKQQTAMTVLGSWAVGNMAISGILLSKSEGVDKHFHQMNIGWNVVNLSLAGFGIYSALSSDPGSFDLFESMEEQHRFQKILLFNAGLDIGYMAGGAYLMERSNRENGKRADQLKGFGKSILLQGAFLFAFDLSTYFVMAADNSALAPLLSKIHFTGDQFSLLVHF